MRTPKEKVIKREIMMVHYNTIRNDRPHKISTQRNHLDAICGTINLKVSYQVIPNKNDVKLSKFNWNRKLSGLEKELRSYLFFDCGINDDRTIVIIESKDTQPRLKYFIDLDVTIFNRKEDRVEEYIPILHKVSDKFFEIVNNF